MNEEIYTVLQLYLSKRTGLLEEMMGREIWKVTSAAQKKKEEIQRLLALRASASKGV
jgi:hypothetical protein